MSRTQVHALEILANAVTHVAGDAAAMLVLFDAMAKVHGFPSYGEMIR